MWPCEIFYEKNAEELTKKIIENNSIRDGGIIRYKGDKYSGRMYLCQNIYSKKSAAWPILNFLVSIVLCMLGHKREATKFYNWIIKKVKNKIPEQIEENGKYRGASPLAWSHAMFVISTKILFGRPL